MVILCVFIMCSFGYKSIYLGESVPLENLHILNKYFDKITYVSYFTVEPDKDEVNQYIKDIKEKVLAENGKFWVTGRITEHIHPSLLNDQIKTFKTILEISNEL